MAADPVRQLTIKTKVVQRIAKEVQAYQEDTEKQAARAQQWEDEGRDEYDVRKQREVAEESRVMIAEAETRLQAALEDLRDRIEEFEEDAEGTEELELAQQTLAEYDAEQ